MSDDDLLASGPTLTAGFDFYYVAHDLWQVATSQLKESDTVHLQYVPKGDDPYTTAGHAGAWLGKAQKKLTRLVLLGHGGPGAIIIGQNLTSDNVAPLAGWISSFFDSQMSAIQLLGCSSAADMMTNVGGYLYGMDESQAGPAMPHGGYNLLATLARVSGQKVEGAMNGQYNGGLRLRMTCRRVYPDGRNEMFEAGM